MICERNTELFNYLYLKSPVEYQILCLTSLSIALQTQMHLISHEQTHFQFFFKELTIEIESLKLREL